MGGFILPLISETYEFQATFGWTMGKPNEETPVFQAALKEGTTSMVAATPPEFQATFGILIITTAMPIIIKPITARIINFFQTCIESLLLHESVCCKLGIMIDYIGFGNKMVINVTEMVDYFGDGRLSWSRQTAQIQFKTA